MAPLTMLSIALALGLLCLQVVASDTFIVNSNRTFVFKALPNTPLPARSDDTPELIADSLFDGNKCVDRFVGEVNEGQALYAAKKFCDVVIVDHQNEERPARPVEGYFFDGESVLKTQVAEVWPPGSCEPDQKSLDFLHPKGPKGDDSYDCVSLIYGAWRQCFNNDGQGGTVKSGCVTYTLHVLR